MEVREDSHNCWSTVADFPRYGCGVGGWRDQLVLDTTARAREKGQELFFTWLLNYSLERVPPGELQGVLPDPL